MNIATSWDIEQYQNFHEPEELWQMRRTFLITNKLKYPESQLLKLAQTFINIEIYGCSYAQITMFLIKGLSQGIADEFREKRKLELKKISEAASNVTEARGNDQSPIEIINSGQPNVRKFKSTPFDPDYILPGFVLVFRKNINYEKPYDVISRSCSFCDLPKPKYEFHHSISTPEIIQCSLIINYKLFVCGYGPTRKDAKLETSCIALNILKEKCFIIEEKEVNTQVIINLPKNKPRPINTPVNSTEGTDDKIKDETKLPENNVGSIILKNMGWKEGTGLGKDGQGPLDPIEVVPRPRNMGLGAKRNATNNTPNINSLRGIMREHLSKFVESPKKTLKFSKRFTEIECIRLYKLCLRYKLGFKNVGPKGSQYVVIYKTHNIRDVFYDLINNDGENEYYTLKRANH